MAPTAPLSSVASEQAPPGGAVHVELRRSRFLFFLIILLHGLAMASLFALPCPLYVRFLLCLPVVWSARHSLRPATLSALRLSAANELDCADFQGQWQTLDILPGSTVFPWLIVLNLREPEGERQQALVLLPDQMPKETFRRLQRHLRWRGEMR